MAALVLTVGGQILGGAIGGPIGAAIGGAIGGAVAGALFPQKVSGPRLGDLRVSGTEYGQPVPYVVANPRIAGQIVWASQKRETATTQSAGKGGGPEVTTYTYDVDLVILLSENPIFGVGRVWSNGDLVYNGAVTRSGVWNGLIIYKGEDDQLPDPTYEAGVGAGNAPAYRGRGYVVIQGLQLGNSGQLPNLTFELTSAETPQLIIDAPFTGSLQNTDLISPPFNATMGGDFIYGIEGVTLRSYSNGLASGQIRYIPSQAKNNGSVVSNFYYWAFDFSFLTYQGNPATSGAFTILFGLRPASLVGQVDIAIGYNAGLFSLGCIPLTEGITASFSGVPFSKTFGTFYIVLVAGVDNRADVYCDNDFIGTITTSTQFRGAGFFIGDQIGPFGTGGYAVNRMSVSNVRFGEGFIPQIGRFPIPVDDAVSDVMTRAGFQESDFDVSGIGSYDKRVRALAVGQISTSRSILEQYQGSFFFEASKSDKVYFRARSSSAVASIPYADLRAVESPDSQEDALALVKSNDLEIPSQTSLTYANTAGDYNTATEYSFRVNAAQESVNAVQTALGMNPDEAKGVVDALIVDAVAGQTKANIKVGLKYAFVEPGDVINVTNDDGRIYRMRVVSKKDNLTSIELELVLDDIGAIDFTAITSDDYILVDDVRQIAPTLWEVMDIPLLRDADNENGYYVAVAPDYTDGTEIWDGAVFVRKWATGDFENRFISADACVLGTCTTTLGNWTGGNVFDESNSVTVRVTGQLSSTTRDAMLNSLETNIALVGNELIRFRLATFVQTIDGENEYRLSGLLRGQRGTEQYQTGHVSSERFVLLNTQLRNVIDQNSQIDLASEVKAVTLNQLISSVPGEAFTNTAVRLKPFSVAQLRALADGSDLDVTWNRRTRLSYRYGGTVGTSVPLGEATEAYRVKIFSGATLKRTIDVTSPSYTYLAADIATDGFTTGQTATIVVTQLSEIVGEGFASTVQGIIP